jgi:hypothetical protein
METTTPPPPSEAAEQAEQPEPRRRRGRRIEQRPRPVRLWSWPKLIFYFPLMLAAFVCAIGSTIWPDRAGLWGTLFISVFLINTVIMAFDFPRTASLNLVLGLILLLLGGFLVNQHLYTFWPGLEQLASRIHPEANNHFYWLIGGTFGIVFLIVWIIDFRFNYWLVYPNEIIHRHGVLGNVDRYPAPGLEMRKEITDVFEYAILRSGRLIIQPTKGPPIVLDTVMNIDQKQRDIQILLDALAVEIMPNSASRRDEMVPDESN